MGNQTIDGVPRVDLESICEDFEAGRHWQAVQGVQKLRALLDAPMAAYAHDGGNNQKGDGLVITGATIQGFYSSGDGGGCTFTVMPTAKPHGEPASVSPICCGSCPGGSNLGVKS